MRETARKQHNTTIIILNNKQNQSVGPVTLLKEPIVTVEAVTKHFEIFQKQSVRHRALIERIFVFLLQPMPPPPPWTPAHCGYGYDYTPDPPKPPAQETMSGDIAVFNDLAMYEIF